MIEIKSTWHSSYSEKNINKIKYAILTKSASRRVRPRCRLISFHFTCDVLGPSHIVTRLTRIRHSRVSSGVIRLIIRAISYLWGWTTGCIKIYTGMLTSVLHACGMIRLYIIYCNNSIDIICLKKRWFKYCFFLRLYLSARENATSAAMILSCVMLHLYRIL